MKNAMKYLNTVMLLTVFSLFICAASPAPSPGITIPLYSTGALPSLSVPETRAKIGDTDETMVFNVSNPTLELFRPRADHSNGTAVIIAPGGGFVGLSYEAEGTAVARKLTEYGVKALVLKYRTIRSPDDAMHMPSVHMKEMETVMARAKSGIPAEVPLFAGEPHAVEDGKRALALVRQHAADWGVDQKKIGFIGFSSGAFLAADLAIEDKATRPAFVGLFYGGLRTPVPIDAPPAFIATAADDPYLPNDGRLLYTAWRKVGASVELHLYERGGHGFGLIARGDTSDHWFDEFIWWMQARSLLKQ
ncbi:alpha/beta hydrolase [Acetobacter persici]|nr:MULTISPECIES: alpha/beta hydrolase [Acetobacter]MBS1002008.1 alpha/beta hydrolase [Acetobacter persici]